MIVPMKRVYVLSLASRKKQTTAELGELGAMHVSVRPAESDRLAELRSRREQILRARRMLPDVAKDRTLRSDKDADELVDRILSLSEEWRELNERFQRLEAEAEQVSPWEDVAPEDITAVENSGFRVALYELDKDDAGEFSAPGRHFTVYTSRNRKHVLVVAGKDETLPEGEYAKPTRSLSEIEAEMGETRERLQAVKQELDRYSVYYPVLDAAVEPIDREMEFEAVRSGVEEEGDLLWFSGWIPEPSVSTLRTHAREYGWGLLIRDPAEDEEPPVLVERRGIAKLITPVFTFMDSTPGYRERDISIPFLLFLIIFIGMIISDAGYGAILLGIALFFSQRRRAKGKPVGLELLLLIVASVATIIYGAMSGVWFGYPAIAELPFFAQFVVPGIDAFAPGSIDAVITICFVIAFIHLELARVWNLVSALKSPHKLKAVAELGWMAVLVGMFNLALSLVVSAEQYPFLPVSLYLIIGGLISVVVFANQEGNFVRGVLDGLKFTSLIPTALDGVNAFADTMSYLRLFAVGLASVEIGAATNDLAAIAMDGPGLPLALFIILFGHSLNLVMALLGVLVHGIRLNMLEFAGALGMEWSGSAYKPFRYNNS